MWGRNLASLLVFWLTAAALHGCAAHNLWQGAPGTDLSSLQPGMTLEQIEAVVGTSDREWVTSLGVRYRLYRYDAGIAPDKSEAGAILFLDVISLGMVEVMEAVSAGAFSGRREFHDLAVSYDTRDLAIGIFRDVNSAMVLPEDGHNPGR